MTRVTAFAQRDLLVALSYPFSLLMPFASIVVTVAGFAFLSRIVDHKVPLQGGHLNYFTYVIINMAFMLLLNQALQSVAQAIRRDQVAGTMEAIVASNTSIPEMLAGSACWPMAFAALQALAYFAVALPFGIRLAAIDVPAFAAVLLLALLVMIAIGILLGAAVLRFRQAPPSSFITGGAAALLTGVLFPVALLPHPLQLVSWILPLTHALNGIRGALAGEPFSNVAPDIVWLAAATAVLLPVAVVAFAAALRRARIAGTLASY